MSYTLFIFFRDFRIQDNLGLIEAMNNNKNIIPCFIFVEEQINPAMNKYFSHNSVQFLCESLQDLHNNFKKICESSKKGSYKTYKKWCDEYFFLPHRMEPRGLGGIFFDYLNSNNWQSDFQFTKDVGKTFITSYKNIVEQTIKLKWDKADKKMQSHRRSRYTEFNLLYDRGTKFGLQTDGNIDAIFMSLPPSTGW